VKLIALISGGIDSPVASYVMDCAGADVTLLHMDNRPFADDRSIEKVMEIAGRLRSVTGSAFPLYSAPHGMSQESISKSCDTNYQCVMCKRTMLKVAQEMAGRLGCSGIIMGDSLGQVASQTLKNIRFSSRGLHMPVVRPLIGYDKLEIEKIAKEIGTYEISIIRSEGCTIVPSKPITEADIKKIEKFDESADIDNLILKAADGAVKLS
jgi:thiamine biosynthesis protein ThiI